MPRLTLRGVCQAYPGTPPVEALRGVDLTIEQGELVSIVGPSGSGKSSLMQIVALLASPTSGSYEIGDTSTSGLSDRSRTRLRSSTFGFVFQAFHLLDRQSAADNVELALLYRDLPRSESHQLAVDALDSVGLADRVQHAARLLSGGERQRVAIARATVSGAQVIVADEPTGSLDSQTSAAIMEQLKELNRTGRTVIIVTHDLEVAAAADRTITIRDGLVLSDSGRPFASDCDALDDLEPIGRPARVQIPALVSDALRSVRSKTGRTTALVLAIAVAVAMGCGTITLASTAKAQVSNQFDVRRNRQASAASAASEDGADHLPTRVRSGEADRSTQALSGVTRGGIAGTYEPVTARASSTSPAVDANLLGASAGYLEAVHAKVRGPAVDRPLGPQEMYVGATLADELHIGPLEATPTILVNGRPFAIRGIITESQRTSDPLTALVMDDDQAAQISTVTNYTALVETVPGAAPQVARQLPLALDPTAETRFDVTAPPDPRSLRDALQSDVSTTLLTLTVIAAVAAIAAIANTIMMSVMERTAEFGLRRALGARQAHVAATVMIETTAVGLLGGIIGLLLGLGGVLAISLLRGWAPVLAPGVIPLAVSGGTVVGLVGGLAPAARASRMKPGDALRE